MGSKSSTINIPLSANAWVTKRLNDAPEVITEYGLGNWMHEQSVTSVYFYVPTCGQIDVSIRCKVPLGKSRIQIRIGNQAVKVDVDGDQYKDVHVGKFTINQIGYARVDLKGVSKTGGFFADVSHILISGEDVCKVVYVRDETHDKTYWGRRGPSIHLSYETPAPCKYYYNEVFVPNGFDTIGSYFAAIGFDGGYSGIQVNSESERRVLFSVWSPFNTDEPDCVPSECKVILVRRGESTVTCEFGGEGCGGQSFIRYMWDSGTTFKFLIEAKPDCGNTTIYSCWFNNEKGWKFVASWCRPQTHAYLTGFYSFSENFEPDTSFITRKAFFGNQWVCDVFDNWHEITSAKLTGDEVASDNIRLDFNAGICNDEDGHEKFYLHHCGFINDKISLQTQLKRQSGKRKPNINFEELP